MARKLESLQSIDNAIDNIAKKIKIKLIEERIKLVDALHRISAKDIVSEFDIPYFNKSSVDGYAVRAEDTYGASESNPIALKVIGTTRPFSRGLVVGRGEAVKIFTGDPLPSGADAVVMLEDVIEEGDTIYVLRSLSRYANVALHGEDIHKGKVLIQRGEIIEPKHLAALASIGISEVEVYERIKVCILCTGNEVVEPGSGEVQGILEKGLTFNSTGILLTTFIKTLGFAEPIYMGIVGDDKIQIATMLRKAINECHVVVTTGGAGPSEQDVTVDVVESVNGEIVVRGIAMRPGRPTSAGIVEGKPVFILSGFPVAALLGFKYFVLPSLEKAFGLRIPRRIVKAKLIKRVANVAGYTTFVRVKIRHCGDSLCAEPIASMGSGTISTILDSDGVLVIPAHSEGFDEGQYVDIEIL